MSQWIYVLFFALLPICWHHLAYNHEQSYQESIREYAHTWTTKYISHASDLEKQTIISLLILCYEIIQESCSMIMAKTAMHHELFKLYTPSCIDSWYENLQIQQNNTHSLELWLDIIKTCQNNLQKKYDLLKNLIPSILQINPQPTQILIIDLKKALLLWGKEQHSITEGLLHVHHEFQNALATISDIKIIFDAIAQSEQPHHTSLKDAVNSYAKTNNKIDFAYDQLTQIRLDGIQKTQKFFHTFFSIYFQAISQESSIPIDYPPLMA